MAYGKKTGGRTAGTPNKLTAAKRAETKAFFERILDDEVEANFWRYFMTGYVVNPETKSCVPLAIDPTSWAAFKRAVEYKRGMPVPLTPEGEPDTDFIFGQLNEENNQSRRTDKPN